MDKAPETFKADFELGNGNHFVVEVHRAWSPNGADRFYELVNSGFYDEVRFFRVVPNFMLQFGINGDPAVSSKWRSSTIADDPVKESNKRGYVTFAKTGAPHSRKSLRQDRLKLALRENLKRRKSQARGRSDAIAAPSDDTDLPLHDDGAGKLVK